jgi:pimeloyl-ACP methyl ester carboxylesterase
MFLHEDLLLRGNYVHERGGVMPASIYRTSEGRAEILWLYDEALSHLRIGHESKMVSTRYGETHVLSLGPEDAPPVVFLHGGNILNPTCLRWLLPLAQRYRIHSPDIVGQPGKSAQLRPSPEGDGHAWWVEDVLDGLGLGRVPLVGLSYGAGITLRTAGYAPERVSTAALVSPAGIATGPLGRMLLEAVVPMMAYRLRPSHERLLRAARAILTEHDELAEGQLGAIYRHVKLDTQLPRMATEEELRGFGEPVALFASEQDVFFPGDAVVARAREIVPNLVVAECLRDCRHVPTKTALEHVNEKILALLERHGRGIVNAPTPR